MVEKMPTFSRGLDWDTTGSEARAGVETQGSQHMSTAGTSLWFRLSLVRWTELRTLTPGPEDLHHAMSEGHRRE